MKKEKAAIIAVKLTERRNKYSNSIKVRWVKACYASGYSREIRLEGAHLNDLPRPVLDFLKSRRVALVTSIPSIAFEDDIYDTFIWGNPVIALRR